VPPITTATLRQVALWAPVLLYMSLVFYASSLSKLPVPALTNFVSDKLEHALAYAGLGLVLYRALAGGLRRRPTAHAAVLAVAIAAAYGASDEFHQHFVPHRTMDIYDWLADTTGATAATAALYAWGTLRASHSP
jgi:VanZ family protein